MSFRPAAARRLYQVAPVAYDVRKNGNGHAVNFRISPAIQNSTGIKAGDAVRLDIGTDDDAGYIRLTPVKTATRHWYKLRECHNLYMVVGYTPELAAILPHHAKLTALEVAGISREDGITLKLPQNNEQKA